MGTPSQSDATVQTAGSSGSTSQHPADWPVSQATALGRLLAELPRINVLLVGIAPAVWQLLETRLSERSEPITVWSPGEPLVLPAAIQTGLLMLPVVGALSTRDQQLLLDWLQKAERRVQIISTTPDPLFPQVEAGSFSDTLYYRLNTVCLEANPSTASFG